MKTRKPKIIYALCRRGCGKELASMAKPISGNRAIQQQYQFICADCLSPEEREQMEIAVFGAMFKKAIEG